MKEILIESIRTDGGTQSRVEINEDYVASLAEQIEGGAILPPIEVFNDGADNWCADGFHRIMAHVRLDRRTIKANVNKGTKADAA